MAIDKKFWDGIRWHGHFAFKTISHEHICCYSPADGHDTCDIMIVECADGRWYVEDNWGCDAKGAEGVWNPFDPSDAGPQFLASQAEARQHAVSVVARICGIAETDLAP
jgi:hypothetical protein